MFNFTIELPENWNDKQKLPNIPVAGVALNSPLGIVISCLQGNFAQSLVIHKSKPFYDAFTDRQFSDLYKESREEDSSNIRKEFFLKNSERLASRKRAIGEEKQLLNNEFQILCDFIRSTTSLQNLHLYTERLPFTQEEEQELIAVIKDNDSIQSVTMIGRAKEMAAAIQAIDRPSLQVFKSGLFSRDENYQAQAQVTIDMNLLQAFVGVLGATAVATAFVMLGAAALNPVGVTLAATGTVALAWSAYSFFSCSPRETEAPILAESMSL